MQYLPQGEVGLIYVGTFLLSFFILRLLRPTRCSQLC